MEPLWTKLTVNEKDFFYRLKTSSDGYKLLFTDLVRLFEEELGKEEILSRCEQLNPVFEVTDLTDLLLELGKIFNSTEVETKAAFGHRSCSLSVSGQLFNCYFFWTFDLVEASPEDFLREITLPNLAAISRLVNTQKTLVDLINAKDDEIRDYEESGVPLSRKSLKTKKFSDVKNSPAIKADFKAIIASCEYAVVCDVNTGDNVDNDSNGQATQSCSKSPAKLASPVKEAGKKRIKPPTAINPIVSSKQAKSGLTQTQSQTQLSSQQLKQKLRKL